MKQWWGSVKFTSERESSPTLLQNWFIIPPGPVTKACWAFCLLSLIKGWSCSLRPWMPAGQNLIAPMKWLCATLGTTLLFPLFIIYLPLCFVIFLFFFFFLYLCSMILTEVIMISIMKISCCRLNNAGIYISNIRNNLLSNQNLISRWRL